MKSLERRILAFLIAHNGVYVNPHKVVITLMCDFTIHVSVRYPGKRFRANVAVEYFYNCNNVRYLLGKFGINTFSDLGKIQPHEILKLYAAGDGWLFCLVNEGYLIFQQMNGAMKVIDDDVNYELSGLLNDSKEFINYTSGYFRGKY